MSMRNRAMLTTIQSAIEAAARGGRIGSIRISPMRNPG
jgi:hypothetical protein